MDDRWARCIGHIILLLLFYASVSPKESENVETVTDIHLSLQEIWDGQGKGRGGHLHGPLALF